MMLATNVPWPSWSELVMPPETKSLPGTRAPFRSLIFGLTPVSTTATITLLLPLLKSHASGILTRACGHESFQSASLGLIAIAEPAIARTPATSNRRPTHFLTRPDSTRFFGRCPDGQKKPPPSAKRLSRTLKTAQNWRDLPLWLAVV